MNNCFDLTLMLRKNVLDRRLIPNINLMVIVIMEIVDESISRFLCRCFRTEKSTAHIIVTANDAIILPTESTNRS